MAAMTLYPHNWPGVLCGECFSTGQRCVIELTGEVKRWVPGKRSPLGGKIWRGDLCVEFVGIEHVESETVDHWAQDPIPLTPFATELIAALKEEA